MLSACCFYGLASSVAAFLSQLDLLGLIVLQPFDAAFEHAGHEGHVVLLGDLQAVDDDGRGVRRAMFAPAAEPAPAAVRYCTLVSCSYLFCSCPSRPSCVNCG